MDALAQHLRELIRINRRMLNKLNKDEASLEYMRNAFDRRKTHTQKISEIVTELNQEDLSEEDSEKLKPLFERFNQQSKKIDHAFDIILQESRDKLEDAVKRRKAEEGYQILK